MSFGQKAEEAVFIAAQSELIDKVGQRMEGYKINKLRKEDRDCCVVLYELSD